ncbi:hypothetical protein FHR20_001470 [Sphingomonas leidyi]|uniref:Uncharacterized protein n=1 Tax=Sphingomonas leidyi TaxID=68569 RepID=A0A7X5UYB3_9SPHN|nr:hypothetical protein [Sphingomonas leidyi]NIJ64539.1 hypothetical protein [Sphingomonas leidyi]
MMLALFTAFLTQSAPAVESASPDELRRGLLFSILCVEERPVGTPASGAIDFVPGENVPDIVFNRYAPEGGKPFFHKGRIESASIGQEGDRRVLSIVLSGQSEEGEAGALLTFETPEPKPHEIKLKLEPAAGKPVAFECISVPPMPPAGKKQ